MLLDIHSGAVVGEFHQYVQPCENPTLSDFCRELTGITQVVYDLSKPWYDENNTALPSPYSHFPLYPLSIASSTAPLPQTQVDDGVPLPTCLYLFGKWLRKLKEERELCLMEPGQQYSHDLELCALATWSGEENEHCWYCWKKGSIPLYQ